MRTECVERPAAARTHAVPLLYLPETSRAGIAKGAVAAAFRAETRIGVYELAAMHAGVFIKGHGFSASLFIKRLYKNNSGK